MLTYIARRVLLTLPTLLMVSVIVFTLMRLIPGDPAQVLLGEDADKATIAAMHRELGLENTELHLIAVKGHVEIMTDAKYQETRQRSVETTAAHLTAMKKAGLR